MAKTKTDWLKEAHVLGLKLTSKDKIVDIKAAIEKANPKKHDKSHSKKDASEKKAPAKAGKHSAKQLREAKQEQERQERIAAKKKLETEDEEVHAEKKGPIPVTRPLIERRSKRYQKAAKLIEPKKAYSLNDAVDLAVKTANVRFDSALEIHVKLGVDPKQADQNVRGVVSLPHGTGKTVRVAVFAAPDDQKKAKEAGADIVGDDDFLELLKKEKLDFDVLVSTPQMMVQLGRFAKMLGPKGLMPNPKSGTVTKDVAGAVKRIKAGQLEYRVDAQGIIHAAVGKTSFGKSKLTENVRSLLGSVAQAKPSSVKGTYIEKLYITTTMGPSIPVDLSSI